jgi:hypothetical protein
METIMFLGGLGPAIVMISGGETGADGFQTGDTRAELLGVKGNNRGLGEKYTRLNDT